MLAHYLGLSDAADAFTGAFRIPNFLQNLFGEGALSASFIPVYSRLLAQGRYEDARRVAGTVAGLLGVLIAVLVAAGVSAAPWLVDLITPGYTGAKRELVVRLVRILFPGAGLLVLSAWCLGVLNSHRHFFLSYAAPVVWNAAIIAATLLPPEGSANDRIVIWTAWGAVAGGLLQILVQLPGVLRVAGVFRPALRTADPDVAMVLRTFAPAFLSRGVVQVSAFVDSIIASLLPAGALAALGNAQLLYMLPVSLFGMSVAAAELPELSAATVGGEPSRALRERLERGAEQVAFFVVPSAVALAALGGVIAAAVFQTGAFTAADARYVWAILAAAALGILASTLGRLYASAWYAIQDTRTPLRFALVRIGLTVTLGYTAALHLPAAVGLTPHWGVAGLAGAGALSGWVECALLRGGLRRRLGAFGLPRLHLLKLLTAALAGAGAGWGVLLLLGGRAGPVLTAALTLLPVGAVYLAGTLLLGVPTARAIAARLRRP